MTCLGIVIILVALLTITTAFAAVVWLYGSVADELKEKLFYRVLSVAAEASAIGAIIWGIGITIEHL